MIHIPRESDSTSGEAAGRCTRLARRLSASCVSRFRWMRGRDEGSTLVEFAVTLPVMFMLLFMFMELCLMFYTRDMISEVAREGTRYAMVRGGSCPTTSNPTCKATAAQVNAYVNGIGWPNIGGGTMTVNTVYSDPTNESVGSTVQVTVTYVFKITMPFVPTNSITMSSSSKMYIIQ